MSIPHPPDSRQPRTGPQRGTEAHLAALVNLYRRAIDRYEEAQGELCSDHASTNASKQRAEGNTCDNEVSVPGSAGAKPTLPHQEHGA